MLRKGWLAVRLGMYKGHRRHAQANRHDLRLFTAKPAESRCPQSRKEKFHPELQLGLCYCLQVVKVRYFRVVNFVTCPMIINCSQEGLVEGLDRFAIGTLKFILNLVFIYVSDCWECIPRF